MKLIINLPQRRIYIDHKHFVTLDANDDESLSINLLPGQVTTLLNFIRNTEEYKMNEKAFYLEGQAKENAKEAMLLMGMNAPPEDSKYWGMRGGSRDGINTYKELMKKIGDELLSGVQATAGIGTIYYYARRTMEDSRRKSILLLL